MPGSSHREGLRRAATESDPDVGGAAHRARDPTSAVGVLLHDAEAGADLEGTLDRVHHGAELLNGDLEALRHNFLFRRYFKKQEKAAARAAREAEAARVDDAASADAG